MFKIGDTVIDHTEDGIIVDGAGISRAAYPNSKAYLCALNAVADNVPIPVQAKIAVEELDELIRFRELAHLHLTRAQLADIDNKITNLTD